MTCSVLRRLFTAALLAGSLPIVAACASPVALGAPADGAPAPPDLPRHLAVHGVELRIRGHVVNLVGHVDLSEPGRVRAHLGTEMGVTGMDVEVTSRGTTVHDLGALAGVPRVVEETAENLSRAFGHRSVFSAQAAGARQAPDGVAYALADGSWAVVRTRALHPAADVLEVTVLRPDRVPEAVIRYEDRDAAGVYRFVTIDDPRDRYVVTVDVVDVLPADGP